MAQEQYARLNREGDELAAGVEALGQELARGGTHLPQLGHGLTGDDLIAVQPGDKAEGLELTLPLLQLPQDQGSEDFHILKGEGRMGARFWKEGARVPVHRHSA